MLKIYLVFENMSLSMLMNVTLVKKHVLIQIWSKVLAFKSLNSFYYLRALNLSSKVGADSGLKYSTA